MPGLLHRLRRGVGRPHATGLSAKAGSFAKSTAGAPATQAVTGVGFQPKALILFCDEAVDNTFTAAGAASWGLATKTADQRSVAVGSTAASPTVCRTRASQQALTIMGSSGTVVAECDLISMDADGFTVTWTTNDGNAYLVGYLAVGGSAVTGAAVVEWVMPTTAIAQAVTGVGFTPACVVHLASDRTAFNSNGSKEMMGLGVMTPGAQWAGGVNAVNASTASNTTQSFSNAACIDIPHFSQNATPDAKAAYTSMDADGFTVTFSNVTGTTGQKVFSLCLKGGHYKAVSYTKSTGAAPATQAMTGAGFAPAAVLMMGVGAQTTVADNVADGAAPSLGAASSASARAVIVRRNPDSANPANTKRIFSSTGVGGEMASGSDAYNWKADLASLDGDGATLTLNPNTGSAARFGILYLGT